MAEQLNIFGGVDPVVPNERAAPLENPAPGSDEAARQGCVCPSMDNCGGRGYRYFEGCQPSWVIRADCKLHGRGRA